MPEDKIREIRTGSGGGLPPIDMGYGSREGGEGPRKFTFEVGPGKTISLSQILGPTEHLFLKQKLENLGFYEDATLVSSKVFFMSGRVVVSFYFSRVNNGVRVSNPELVVCGLLLESDPEADISLLKDKKLYDHGNGEDSKRFDEDVMYKGTLTLEYLPHHSAIIRRHPTTMTTGDGSNLHSTSSLDLAQHLEEITIEADKIYEREMCVLNMFPDLFRSVLKDGNSFDVRMIMKNFIKTQSTNNKIEDFLPDETAKLINEFQSAVDNEEFISSGREKEKKYLEEFLNASLEEITANKDKFLAYFLIINDFSHQWEVAQTNIED